MKAVITALVLSGALSSWATRAEEPTQRSPGAALTESESSSWEALLKNSEASLYTSVAGPSLGGGNMGTSYNPFAGDRWPVQMYSALYLGYRLDSNWTLGAELSGVWNATTTTSRFGNEIQPSLSIFNPAIQLKRGNLVNIGWFDLFQTVQVFLPATEFSRIQQTMLISATLEHTYTFHPIDRRWLFGFNTRVQPTIYRQPVPQSPSEAWRQTFFVSGGHFLNYRLSQYFELLTETTFDAAHWGGSQGYLSFAPANDDRWRATMRWTPGIPLLANAGVFIQGLIFKPSLDATIVGADVTLRL